MIKKYNDQLNEMYDQHPKLKDRLIYVINHPLNLEQFEAEWVVMCDEFGLHDRVTMHTLYNNRRMWIVACFKEVFCWTIQSTQRSESINSMVKEGYLDNSKSVHEFAKCFLDALVHIHDNKTREKYYSHVWFLVYSYSTFRLNDLVFHIKWLSSPPCFCFLHQMT
jgi:hypothetical protein